MRFQVRKIVFLGICGIGITLLGLSPVVYGRTFTWSDTWWGAKVKINFTTEESWTTNNTYQIAFSFTCDNISTETFYDNSHIKLAKVKLDVGFVYERIESPFENITEGNTWTASWSFSPKAQDFTVNRDESKSFTLYLDITYYVVETDGTEHSATFYNSDVSIKVVGGPDAPKPSEGPGIPGFPWESILLGLMIGVATLFFLKKRKITSPVLKFTFSLPSDK